ncbi:TPA: hypothetical protein JG871_003911 [Enterobacter hormaechei subsp. xiangfangensis]|nr:hypothetical protein [Enterobacter hormaechei subsp. xiangfangensis]
MKTHSFESRGERVITFGRGATLLGVSYGVLRKAAVRDHYRLNGLIWTLAESELASHYADVPFTRGRKSLVVITETAIRILAEHFDTPAALAIVNDENPLAAFYDEPAPAELELTPEQLAEAERQLAAIRERYKDHPKESIILPDGFRTVAELVAGTIFTEAEGMKLIQIYGIETRRGYRTGSLRLEEITGAHEMQFRLAAADMKKEIEADERRRALPMQK